jgi:hypothetical protein
MSQNVKIPLELLNQTIDLLEYIDVSNYSHPIPTDYRIVLSALRLKKQSLALRETYAKVVFAENEDDRTFARMKYLEEKRHIAEYYGG